MSSSSENETLYVEKDLDLVSARKKIREYAQRMHFGLVHQTKLITAASELIRNMIEHAGGGQIKIRKVSRKGRQGLELVFADRGPGIEDIQLAMKDGYSTGNGMGLGLPGASRLVNEFNITSVPGKGTTVTILMWKG